MKDDILILVQKIRSSELTSAERKAYFGILCDVLVNFSKTPDRNSVDEFLEKNPFISDDDFIRIFDRCPDIMVPIIVMRYLMTSGNSDFREWYDNNKFSNYVSRYATAFFHPDSIHILNK